jgi:hypothetical protein
VYPEMSAIRKQVGCGASGIIEPHDERVVRGRV